MMDQENVKAMHNLLSMFDDDSCNTDSSNDTKKDTSELSEFDANKREMKKILESFEGFVDETCDTILKEEFTKSERDEIINTKIVENGFLYKAWECLFDKKLNEYVIRSGYNKQIIYRFILKESALLILKLLNDDIPLSHNYSQMVMENDRRYLMARSDIVHYTSNKIINEARIQRANDILFETHDIVKKWLKQYRTCKKIL